MAFKVGDIVQLKEYTYNDGSPLDVKGEIVSIYHNPYSISPFDEDHLSWYTIKWDLVSSNVAPHPLFNWVRYPEADLKLVVLDTIRKIKNER